MSTFSEFKGRIDGIDKELEQQNQAYQEEQARLSEEEKRLLSEHERISTRIAEDLITLSNAPALFDRISTEILNGAAKVQSSKINYTPPKFEDVSDKDYLGHGGSMWSYLLAPKISWTIILESESPAHFDLNFNFSSDEWSVKSPYHGSAERRNEYLRQIGIRRIDAHITASDGINPKNSFPETQYVFLYKVTPDEILKADRWLATKPHPHTANNYEYRTALDDAFAQSLEESAFKSIYDVIKRAKQYS